MRITKKMLREAKAALQTRLKELAGMSGIAIQEEFYKQYPHREPMLLPTVPGMRLELYQDAIDRAIPDRWVD